MILDIPAVMRDASVPAGTIAPAVPTAFPITWPRGEDGVLRLTVRKQDGEPHDLTDAVIKFGLRRFAGFALVVTADIIDEVTGRADVVLPSEDTALLAENSDYWFDVQLTQDDKRWQVVPRSLFRIVPAYAVPDDEEVP